ncbi:MAG: response regulator [Lachnospiraceae bacterium]|nr:response regulator [Lachnospiraceae bacterium]
MYQIALAVQWINIFIILTETWIVFKKMKCRLHYYLYMMCISTLIYSTGYLLALFSDTEEAYFQSLLMSWGGKIWIVFSLLYFCLELSGVNVPKRLLHCHFIFTVIMYAVVITTKRTGLFYRNTAFDKTGDMPDFRFDAGPLFYLWELMVFCTIVVGLVFLYRALARERNLQKRKQLKIVMMALLCELIIGGLVMMPIHIFYDLNQLGFSISAILIIIAIFRDNLMDTESIARDYMIDELSAGVIASDTDGEVAYYNKAALQVFPELENDAPGVLEQVRRAILLKEPITINERIYTFEERKLIQNGLDVRKIYVIIDATVHYVHLKELEEQRRIADEANKTKSDFLANMSHDIRTPINVMLGLDEMILRDSTESPVKGYAIDIQRAGETLLSIIDDILDLSKIESGRMDIVPVKYDVSSVLYDLSNMIVGAATEKKLSFEMTVTPNIPARLWGDDARLTQVLLNILTNAVKYTRRGSIWFRISLKDIIYEPEEEERYAIIHFEVEDTGIGIKSSDMKRLFSEFERIEAERNRNIEGTGLGLAITTKILSLMGSKLNVKSEYGRGSVFSFDLKQLIIDDTPIGDFEERIRHRYTDQYVYTESFTAPDAHILIVDDNSMNRKVFAFLLKQTQVKITEAGSGHESVALAAKQHFDLIFMDHMMPGMDGIEALKRIRVMKHGPCANTPIIVLTANAVAGSREQYLEEGFDDFLSKPIAGDVLEDAIRKWLPKELVKAPAAHHEAPAEKESVKKAPAEEFPVIFGVDWKVAMMRLQNKDILKSVLGEFSDTIDLQADKLEGFRTACRRRRMITGSWCMP